MLVSLELVGCGLGNCGLGSDALVESINFVSKTFSLACKSGEVVGESLLLFIELSDGIGVFGGILFPSVLDVLSKGLEELGNSFEGRFIELLFVDGELSEGSEYGGIEDVFVGVNGVVKHLLSNLGEFNETSTSVENGTEDILSLFNGVEGILIVLASLGEE